MVQTYFGCEFCGAMLGSSTKLLCFKFDSIYNELNNHFVMNILYEGLALEATNKLSHQ